jgi:hypothetical protein
MDRSEIAATLGELGRRLHRHRRGVAAGRFYVEQLFAA